MRNLRKYWLSALILVAFGSLHAQPSGDGGATVDLGADVGVQANISPEEMTSRAGSLFQEIEAAYARLTSLVQEARNSRDIIKLNCVNDKLLQVKQLLNIAENARGSLANSVSTHDEGGRYHQFSILTLSADKTRTLRDEAEACIGQELVFSGRANIDVDAPDVPDDPTATDPFGLGSFDIERPTYATPFL